MHEFWRGFNKQASSIGFKKHVILIFTSTGDRYNVSILKKLRDKNPTIKFKTIYGEKDPEALRKHSVAKLPTFILLKNGREIDRIESNNYTILEDFVRKAVI